jgi:hypothetical protein
MSIAEQIMVGTQQQLGQTNILAQNLSALGQQVGRQLAINQYQKDAAAVLPAMRESYKSAFDKMGKGKYADGYMELLDTNLQFGATTNPFIAQFADQANQTAKQMESALWRESQYGGRGAGGGGTLPAMGRSGADVVRQRAGRSVAAQPVTTGDAEAASIDIGNAVMLPEGTPIDGESPIAEVTAPNGQPLAGQGAELNPVQAATRDAALARDEKPPEERIAYSQEVLALNPPAKGYEEQAISAEDFYGTNKIYIPKPGEELDSTYTITGTSGSTETRETLTEKTRFVGEEEYKETKKIVKDANDAMAYISKNRPANTKKTFKQVILEGGGPEYFNLTPNDGSIEDAERFPGALVNIKTDEQYFVTEDESKKIFSILALPTLVESRGVRFGEGAKSAAKAPAAAPAGNERFPVKQGAAPSPTPAATQAPEATLEERIASKTKSAAIPTRTVTPQQQATLERTRQSQTQSNLQSEKTRLERVIYETPRVGQRKLKSGLTQKDPDVKEVLAKITEINKKLEGL